MKNLSVKSFTTILLVLLVAASAQAWTNGQNAAYVIGQADFTSQWSETTVTGLNRPSAVALDTINGKLYIADYANNRVLRYAWPITGNQPAAEVVFGQPDFTTPTRPTTNSEFNLWGPTGLAVDAEGRLWVSCSSSRVVWFDNAHLTSGNQPAADGVLGQPDFTSYNHSPAAAPNTMHYPRGIAIDMNGTLWVVDNGFNRVLRFDNAADKANGADADGVLGQVDFESLGSATTQNGVWSPMGVAVFGSSIYVGEWRNERVLRFDNATNKANGANADGVLGQVDFTSYTVARNEQFIDDAGEVVVDGSGRLYSAGGHTGDRVMIFDNAHTKANGGNADSVLGFPNFTAKHPNGAPPAPTRNNFVPELGQMGVAIDSRTNTLLVCDSGNSRVLVFTTSFAGPEINVKTGLSYLPSGDRVDFDTTWERTFTIENPGDSPLVLSGTPAVSVSGADADQFSVTTQPAASVASTGSSSFTIRMRPTSNGAKTATVTIASNDTDEPLFSIDLAANVTSLIPPSKDSGGDGGSGSVDSGDDVGSSCFINTMR